MRLLGNSSLQLALRTHKDLIIATTVDNYPQKLDVSPYSVGRVHRNLQTLVLIFRALVSHFPDIKLSNMLINMKKLVSKSLK